MPELHKVNINSGLGIGTKQITVNGIDLSNIVNKAEVTIEAAKIPQVTLHCHAKDGVNELLTEAHVTAVVHDVPIELTPQLLTDIRDAINKLASLIES